MSTCSSFKKGDAIALDTARPPPRQCASFLACVNLVRPRLRLRALQVDPGSIGDATCLRTRADEPGAAIDTTPIC
jgi:hypothetical protein